MRWAHTQGRRQGLGYRRDPDMAAAAERPAGAAEQHEGQKIGAELDRPGLRPGEGRGGDHLHDQQQGEQGGSQGCHDRPDEVQAVDEAGEQLLVHGHGAQHLRQKKAESLPADLPTC